MEVLVVDDYATMRRIGRNLLGQLGHMDVDEAADGASALQQIRSARFDLVVSDWNMDPMTGHRLLKEVRADKTLGATKFIMVTAESKTENVVAAEEAGVDNHIVKPFDAETCKRRSRPSWAVEAFSRRGDA